MARILVVDDSGLSRRMSRKILEEAGHQVIEAEDGISAIERYFIDKPDLVQLDVTMKGMSGLDVLKKLREMDARARVVIVTADIQVSTRTLSKEGGASGFVIKPLTSNNLLQAVETALQGDASCN
jgi:two-component system, chemotaxis family, chemotaxis protein CheY